MILQKRWLFPVSVGSQDRTDTGNWTLGLRRMEGDCGTEIPLPTLKEKPQPSSLSGERSELAQSGLQVPSEKVTGRKM